MILQRHVSFIDCPGHNLLLSTMLNGTCVMDTVIIVESFNNITIPNQQTQEHLLAIGLKKIPVAFSCINKADLVKKNTVMNKIGAFDDYLKSQGINKPIIPVSANKEINIDVICEYLCTQIPVRELATTGNSKMIVIRSFNVNKPNCKFNELVGGIVGGSIIRGSFNVGDNIKLLPGLVSPNKDSYIPIFTKIISINSEETSLSTAKPSGLIGMCLDIDPGLTANDNMIGQIILKYDVNDPDNNFGHGIFNNVTVNLEPINDRYKQLTHGDLIRINYNGTNANAKVLKIKDTKILLELSGLICIKKTDIVTISKPYVGKDSENACGVILGSASVLNGKIIKMQ
jgi:translation initiation factor 2 subunit 3